MQTVKWILICEDKLLRVLLCQSANVPVSEANLLDPYLVVKPLVLALSNKVVQYIALVIKQLKLLIVSALVT